MQQQHDHGTRYGCLLSVAHAIFFAVGISLLPRGGFRPCDELIGDISLLLAKTVSIESGMESHP